MSKTAIVKSGEHYFIKQLSNSQPIKLDRVIFANINGINSDTEIDLTGSMPTPDQIVHTAPVTQAGLLNDKTVVYSVILDTNVGDFTFNYIGLVNSETNTLCMVMHTNLTKKIKTAGQRQGNTITESIWLEIDNASESTGITVNAETWQIDYSKRLAGEDERIRLTNYDLYDRLVIHHGLAITKNGNQLTVAPGLAYVVGLRVELNTDSTITIENNQSLYVDAWLAGTVTGEWVTHYNLIVGTNLRDYHDGNFQHYVEHIASVDPNGNLIVVNPKSFVTTYDHASTENWGIVKLNSSTSSTSKTEAATPLAVKTVNDLLKSISVKFHCYEEETRVYSGDKKQYIFIRDDGLSGFVDTDKQIKWAFDVTGSLIVGTVPVNNISGLIFNSSTNSTAENQIATPMAVNKVNGLLQSISVKFHCYEEETRVYSGDKKQYIFIRDDGISGFVGVDRQIKWFFDANGSLGSGTVHVDRVLNLDQFVRDRIAPVGVPMPWPQAIPPSGWCECNGAPIDKNRFPKLAAAYPSGFLPDMRGEFIRGWDAGRGVDPGRGILSWQDCAIQSHNHSINSLTSFSVSGNTTASVANGTPHVGWTNNTGDHETRPRNFAFMYILKAE